MKKNNPIIIPLSNVVHFLIKQRCTTLVIYNPPSLSLKPQKKIPMLFWGLLVEMGKMFIFALLLTN